MNNVASNTTVTSGRLDMCAVCTHRITPQTRVTWGCVDEAQVKKNALYVRVIVNVAGASKRQRTLPAERMET